MTVLCCRHYPGKKYNIITDSITNTCTPLLFPVDCRLPPSPADGAYINPTMWYSTGSVLDYTCNQGYIKGSTDQLTCEIGGVWSGAAVCKGMYRVLLSLEASFNNICLLHAELDEYVLKAGLENFGFTSRVLSSEGGGNFHLKLPSFHPKIPTAIQITME